MASEKKQKPAGAALVMIDDITLGMLLNLPKDVWVEKTFVPHMAYGPQIGFILWTNQKGILPPIELFQQYEDISARFRFEHTELDGKGWLRAVGLPAWDLPEDKPDLMQRLPGLEQMAARGYELIEDLVEAATDDDHYAIDQEYRDKIAEARAYLAEYKGQDDG